MKTTRTTKSTVLFGDELRMEPPRVLNGEAICTLAGTAGDGK